MLKEKLKQKISESVNIDKVTGCWNWVGKLRNGYPYFYHNYKNRSARQTCFETYIGEIFDRNIRIKNTCGNTACVNPEHLELGLKYEVLRDKARDKRNNKYCKYGHSLENSVITKNGYRACKKCRDERNEKRKREWIPRPKTSWTHCKHGHSLHDAYIKKNGSRNCKTCVMLSRTKAQKG